MSNVVQLVKHDQDKLFDPDKCILPTIYVGKDEIVIREYKKQRVITFDIIDKLHEKEEGVSRSNFSRQKKHFIEGEDYFVFRGQEGREALQLGNYSNLLELSTSKNFVFYLFTQSGYLMLAKCFNDDLAWSVQRTLVNNYFSSKAAGNMFSLMRRIIDVLEENQKVIEDQKLQIEAATERLDEIDEMHDVEVDPSWLTANKIAKKLKLYSTNGLPHSSLVSAIATKAGINISRRAKHKDDYVAVIAKREGDTVIWEVYFTPVGEDAIVDWWYKNENKTRFTNLYKRSTGEHSPGDVKQMGHKIGRRSYYLAI